MVGHKQKQGSVYLPDGSISTTQLSIGIHVDDLLITCPYQAHNLISYLTEQFDEVLYYSVY